MQSYQKHICQNTLPDKYTHRDIYGAERSPFQLIHLDIWTTVSVKPSHYLLLPGSIES